MKRRLIVPVLLIVGLGVTSAQAVDWERISINGYTSFEIEHQWEKSGNGDPNTSFDADLFDLVMNFQVTDRVRAACDITWEHGTATEDGRGNAALEYGFVEYSFSDLLRVRVGKMFTPFGIFNEIHTAKPAFLAVKEAASTNKPERIVDGARRFFPRWGVGIEMWGDGMMGDHSWNYNLQLTNGDQESTNPFEEDNNRSKAVTGRIRVNVTDELLLGASAYFDKPDFDGVEKLHSEGIQFEYEHDKLRVLAEAVYGTYDLDDGSTVNQLGAFVQPSYHFDNGMTPYLQFEWIDPNRDATDVHGTDLIVGLNWEPERWFMIKIENNWFHGGKNTALAEYPGRDYNELKAAVVLGF